MSFGTGCNRRLAYSIKLRIFLSVFIALFFLILIKDSILYDFYIPREPIDSKKALHWSGDPIAKGDPRWQEADIFAEVFIYSAHYDDIGLSPLIRVIGIALDPLPYFFVKCRYYEYQDGPVVYSVSGEVLHMRERNGRSYLGAYVECPLDESYNFLPYALTVDKGNNSENLNFMIINYSRDVLLPPIERTSTESEYSTEDYEDTVSEFDEDYSDVAPFDWQWNITRCFPAFHMGYDDHIMLAEMVAVSRLLGVQHFVFYVKNAGKHVLDMLEVLKAQGDAEVLPWNLNLSEQNLYYAGQFASINDCLYRHLWTSRFLLFADADEIFVPRDQPSLFSLLDEQFAENPECGAYLFLNVFFNLRFPTAVPRKGNKTTLNFLQRLKVLTHTRRHKEVLGPAIRSKPAVDPRRVHTGSVHIIQKFRDGYETCVMSRYKGLLHHYRDFPEPPLDEQENDPYLWEIFADIVAETKMILDEYDEMVK
ncbi:uncharacterized protein [Littorina saxatilis]|uniref:Glycosyltransferase family 92 protein n=1 Tax=Littorina saxatilis TaxID=31220 RepID=A0AAN9AWE6_9CAEN